MSLLCRLPCHRFTGGNIRLLSWFSDDKRGKRPRCLTSSAGVKNAAHWRGNKIPDTSDLSSLRLKWDPLRSQSTAAPWITGSPLVSQTGLTWRVTPSLLSQRRRPCPKKQNLCSLNCWLGTKGGSSLPLCLSLFTVLFVNDTIDMERLWFLSWENKAHFPCSHVTNLILKIWLWNWSKFLKG